MSGDRATSPCSKFEANIFNKSKCQNCFKSRELHSLIDQDLQQVKPVYGGWLCLAPEGTDFDNPMHRSRKWQRRFFVLYEDGSLSFALDDQPSTLPQGTMNLNLSCDIMDAELRTGQKNALSIVTAQQEVFIRGDSKEIISGWNDQLNIYLQNNNNHQRKRKVETVTCQEVSPGKMVDSDRTESRTAQCEEEQRETPTADKSTCLSLREKLQNNNSDKKEKLNIIQTETHRRKNRRHSSSTERMLGSNMSEEKEKGGVAARKSRSETRSNKREKLQSSGDVDQLTAPLPQRRTRSLDRRTSDCIVTLDLLNFKKGWLVKLDENGQWKKFWFALSKHSLKFYRDSLAEEAADLEGKIDLTKCFKVSEFKVQRNYGFQIHTPQKVFTIAAMTSGIRKNWIQALTRNVYPAGAPDITSSPENHLNPDLPLDSQSAQRHVSVMQRRREGRYRTYDWAEFRTQSKQGQDQQSKLDHDQKSEPDLDQKYKQSQDKQVKRDQEPQGIESVSSLEDGEQERRRRREERRKRYEGMLGFSLNGDQSADKSKRSPSPESQRREEEEVEECWRRVETSLFRADRQVPVLSESRDSEKDELLDRYKSELKDLKTRLEESEQLRLKLEDQLSRENTQLDLPSSSPLQTKDTSTHCDIPEQLKFITSEPPATRQTPRICLQDSEGNLTDLLQETNTTPISSPASLEENDTLMITDKPADDDFCVERQLRQKIQQLLSQNETLNKKNQEMLNQLTEANSEIERLREELSRRLTETQQLPGHEHPDLPDDQTQQLPEKEQHGLLDEEEQEGTRLVDLQVELSWTNQQLLEAQHLIASLQEKLNEMEELRINEEAGKGNEEKLEASEVDLMESEMHLHQSELTCEELNRQNAAVKEVQKPHRQSSAEVEPQIWDQTNKNGKRSGVLILNEGKMQKLMEKMVKKLKKLWKLKVCLSKEEKQREEDFCSFVLGELQLQQEMMEQMIVERRRLLLGLGLIPETDLCMEEGKNHLTDLDLVLKSDQTRIVGLSNKKCLMEQFIICTQIKCSLLNLLSVFISSSKLNRLPSTDSRPSDLSYPLWLITSPEFLSAASEALLCCLLPKYESNLLFSSSLSSSLCTNCVVLMEENKELKAKLSNREEAQVIQTVEAQLQDTKTPCASDDEDQERIQQKMGKHFKKREESSTQTDLSFEVEEVVQLRQQVEELEEKLSIMEEMREQFNGKLSSVQVQHQREMEKLKVTCRRGLTCMEESHLKEVEELQRRHQQEVEHLLMERDRLLEEESAATATAIEAIKSAYRVELQREEQRRRQSESSSGSSHLDDVYRRHNEELASCHRELQVLSQQLSLRCLEVGHLVQALEAERKSLCVCQQENQHLRTRNQELSSHLAAEITRLCSQVKQDDLLLGQRTDTYEMEIMLRVKESEVQCLKQEITSLKDDLQAAQRDQRNTTKKYKEVITDLSIMRAKTERETEELRENLRLAHCALDQTNSMASL